MLDGSCASGRDAIGDKLRINVLAVDKEPPTRPKPQAACQPGAILIDSGLHAHERGAEHAGRRYAEPRFRLKAPRLQRADRFERSIRNLFRGRSERTRRPVKRAVARQASMRTMSQRIES